MSDVLLLLAFLDLRQDDRLLAAEQIIVGMTPKRLQRACAEAVRLGLIDPSGSYLTDAGDEELARAGGPHAVAPLAMSQA
jgi:hypothetical protein